MRTMQFQNYLNFTIVFHGINKSVDIKDEIFGILNKLIPNNVKRHFYLK